MKGASVIVCFVALFTPALTQVSSSGTSFTYPQHRLLTHFQVDLGTAAVYGALAVTGITNTGLSTVQGDVGTTGATIVGFLPGIASGTIEIATAVVDQARADALNAYNTAQALAGSIDSTANSDLGMYLNNLGRVPSCLLKLIS